LLDGEEELERVPQDVAVDAGCCGCNEESAEGCDAYGNGRGDDLSE